ncbi:MAG: Com family DNA-binding transcriptional regulator [Telmatospirillum sp.]|nr:Com family DNA-binding transcriptional regulator [Telmatospirillum sp.]
MESIRCGSCGRKIAEGDFFGTVSIKCPRCGTINELRVEHPSSERPGASVQRSDALAPTPSSPHSRNHSSSERR